MTRVLFVAPQILGTGNPDRKLATFHETDVHILTELGLEVDVLPWRGRPWASLLRRAAAADVLFVWTVGDHTALAIAAGRVLRRPVLVVIGGYEFANLPDIGYGNLVQARGQILSRIAWKYADALLFVDDSLHEEGENAFGGHPGRTFYTVPTGYDTDFWKPDGEKESIVLTVAHAPGTRTLSLKGIDRFLGAARRLPEMQFHIVGELPPGIEADLAPNVVDHGWMERAQVRRLMQSARVYCQLSRHEGLPNALCEAMLCGCIPVGTDVNGIPTAIGDTGIILVPAGPEQEAVDAAAVVSAYRMSRSHACRESARQRIIELFPLERRREALRSVIQGVRSRW